MTNMIKEDLMEKDLDKIRMSTNTIKIQIIKEELNKFNSNIGLQMKQL